MSIVLSKVAEPYAEALLALATKTNTLQETTNDMNIVSQFLANSNDLKKFTRAKIYTLYNPSFKSINIKKRNYKPKNNINILNISRFVDQKDHFTLLKAINIIKERLNFSLLIVGYGKKKKLFTIFYLKMCHCVYGGNYFG